MAHPDPFQNDNPLWQPFALAPGGVEFAMPDTTASGLRSWLRSDEVTKALDRLQPPARLAPTRSNRLTHIPSFPG
jgi:hypothetical protein